MDFPLTASRFSPPWPVGGVVSLRETAIGLTDETLELYAVVADIMRVAQADGNMHCGTDAYRRRFALSGGGWWRRFRGCATKLKKGEVGVFAIRVKAKTTAVASDWQTASTCSQKPPSATARACRHSTLTNPHTHICPTLHNNPKQRELCGECVFTNVTNVKLRYENLHGRRGLHFALDFPSFAYP